MMPDLVGVSLQSLLTRVAKLEGQTNGESPDRSRHPATRGRRVARRGLLYLSARARSDHRGGPARRRIRPEGPRRSQSPLLGAGSPPPATGSRWRST